MLVSTCTSCPGGMIAGSLAQPCDVMVGCKDQGMGSGWSPQFFVNGLLVTTGFWHAQLARLGCHDMQAIATTVLVCPTTEFHKSLGLCACVRAYASVSVAVGCRFSVGLPYVALQYYSGFRLGRFPWQSRGACRYGTLKTASKMYVGRAGPSPCPIPSSIPRLLSPPHSAHPSHTRRDLKPRPHPPVAS